MAVAAANDPPFTMSTFWGETQKVEHHLPVYAEGDGPSFKDVLEAINPLQHIPIISTIYREITGDEPGMVGRLAGSVLYGGPVGLAVELINSGIDDSTGQDIGGHIYTAIADAFGGSSDTQPGGAAPTAVASADSGKQAIIQPPLIQQPTRVAAAEPPPPAAAPLAPVQVQAEPAAKALFQAPAKPLVLASAQTMAAGAAPGAQTPAPLQRTPRFMPVPHRRAVEVAPHPLVTVPLSTNGEMSNIPQAGTYRSKAPPPILVPPSPADPAPAAANAGQKGPLGKDWFSAAMMRGLDKYETARRLGTLSPSAAGTP